VTLLVVFAGVADAVNGIAVARDGWVTLAKQTGAALRLVEVRCDDPAEHRRRVESRQAEMPGQHIPTWDEVSRRDFEPWPPELAERLVVIDNVGDPAAHVARIVSALRA
jgi:predicted kinase